MCPELAASRAVARTRHELPESCAAGWGAPEPAGQSVMAAAAPARVPRGRGICRDWLPDPSVRRVDPACTTRPGKAVSAGHGARAGGPSGRYWVRLVLRYHGYRRYPHPFVRPSSMSVRASSRTFGRLALLATTLALSVPLILSSWNNYRGAHEA